MTGTAGNLDLNSGDCVAFSGTRAQVLALRAANTLPTSCAIEITDWTQGTTLPGPNRVRLEASSSSVLGTIAQVFTPFDNVALPGVYDIDLLTGTMIELTDTRGNTIRDSDDGATLGQFPWGNANYRNNYIENSVLTGWATQVGIITGNRIQDAAIDLTGKTSGAWTDSTIIGGSFQGRGTTVLTRARLSGWTCARGTSLIGMSIVDSDVIGGSMNIANGIPAGGTLGFTNSRVTNCIINKTVNGAGSNILSIIDSTVQGHTMNIAGGSTLYTRCTVSGGTFNITSNRGLTMADCIVAGSTITQNRTNVANTDAIIGLEMAGNSTLTLSGGSAGGVGSQVVVNSRIANVSTVDIGDQTTVSAPLVQSIVENNSTVTIPGNARWISSRASGAAIVTMPGGQNQQTVVIELAGATALTAANTNRQANKGFSDVV